ncbi:MAG: hypothetical protein KF819_12880 [Labilithrix sp.]|nr:hypothetical protein [Labilithrix sp.]
MRTRVGALAIVATFVAAAAPGCASASGDVVGGGPRFDAGLPDPLVQPINEPSLTEASPTSWGGLYRDFFGKRARGGCAGTGACHGSIGRPGVSISGFVCADIDDCWRSMRQDVHPSPMYKRAMVQDDDVAAPDGAFLFKVLRVRLPDGTVEANLDMPQQPRDFAFSEDDVARMKTWIRNGGLNDR